MSFIGSFDLLMIFAACTRFIYLYMCIKRLIFTCSMAGKRFAWQSGKAENIVLMIATYNILIIGSQ